MDMQDRQPQVKSPMNGVNPAQPNPEKPMAPAVAAQPVPPAVAAQPVKPVKPATEELVDLEAGISGVGALKTKVTQDTSKTVAMVLAGAAAALLGVVVGVDISKGKRWW
jgi:hypothetical protein